MYNYNAEVIRVVDGDTIQARVDLGFETWKVVKIRFYGINTPESRTRDLEEKLLGLAAKDRLIQLLNSNDNKFILQSHGVGKFGRCLGELFIPEHTESINKILINEGHAEEYYGGSR